MTTYYAALAAYVVAKEAADAAANKAALVAAKAADAEVAFTAAKAAKAEALAASYDADTEALVADAAWAEALAALEAAAKAKFQPRRRRVVSQPKGIIWDESSDECVCTYCKVCRGE